MPDMRQVKMGDDAPKWMDLDKPAICRCVRKRPAFDAEYASIQKGASPDVWKAHFMARAGDTLTCPACNSTAVILPKPPTPKPAFVHHKCIVCGARASRHLRIYRSGECRDCYEERKMGY